MIHKPKEVYVIKRLDAGSVTHYINEGYRLWTSDISESKKFQSENEAMMFIDNGGLIGSFCILKILENQQLNS